MTREVTSAARDNPGYLRFVVVELIAWSLLPATFMAIYISVYGAPLEAIWPHLRLALIPVLGIALVRLALSRALGARAARSAAALLASAVLLLMIAYYGLTLIGLRYWGQVISWDLITSYAAQAPRLAETLEISLTVFLGGLALVYIASFFTVRACLHRYDWAGLLGPKFSSVTIGVAVCAGAGILAIELYKFSADPATQEGEPLSLTFYPRQAAIDFEGYAIDDLAAARRDTVEDAARAAYMPSPGASRRNVVLIVIDALRADHMGLYGYGRDTTPHLARLEQAGLMRKARSMRAACSSSVCGLVSIASSRFGHQFSGRPVTLAEVLKRYGYRVHMMLSGNHTLFYGLRDSYGEVDTYFDAHPLRPGEYMNDDRKVIDYLSRFPTWDGTPVMMQFHLMSVHALGWRDPAFMRYRPAANYSLFGLAGNARPRDPRAVNHYDNGILQADATVNVILEMLEAKGYLRNAVVAITSDHGEALGEHGLFTHSNGVHEETLNVPFLLLSYGYRPSAPIDGASMASQVDISPTLIAELGMTSPATWKGVPLQFTVERDFLYFQERWLVGIFDLRDQENTWKYWSDLRTGKEYAFEVRRDPHERRNLIDETGEERLREWRREVLGASSTIN